MEVTEIAERPTMCAKKRAVRGEYASVKLPADVMETARIVAAYRGVTIADMLGDMLRPMLAKAEREEFGKRSRAGEAPTKKGKGAK